MLKDVENSIEGNVSRETLQRIALNSPNVSRGTPHKDVSNILFVSRETNSPHRKRSVSRETQQKHQIFI